MARITLPINSLTEQRAYAASRTVFDEARLETRVAAVIDRALSDADEHQLEPTEQWVVPIGGIDTTMLAHLIIEEVRRG